jgi:hypothetical protein
VAKDNIVAWYRFNGDYADSSGNSYDLTNTQDGYGVGTMDVNQTDTSNVGERASINTYLSSAQYTHDSSSYAYLSTNNTSLTDTFNYNTVSGATVSMWVKVVDTAPTVNGLEYELMDIFSVGDHSLTDGSYNLGEGFRIQLMSKYGPRESMGDANGEYYVSVCLGAPGSVYMDTRKADTGTKWSDNNFPNVIAAGEISDGEWHNVVVSYDPRRQLSSTYNTTGYGASNTICLYIDGIRINNKGSSTSSLDYGGAYDAGWGETHAYDVGRTSGGDGVGVLTIGDSLKLAAGTQSVQYNYPFAGYVTDIRVYNRSLVDDIEDTTDYTVTDTAVASGWNTNYTTWDHKNEALSASEISCLYNSGSGDLHAPHNLS